MFIQNHLDVTLHVHCYNSFIYSPTDALVRCLKKTILKFTLKFILKQLRYISVLQLHLVSAIIRAY